uniref:Uncharacterized protein n=1 Tax=Gloeochaete wittrockiana TaxID=38269 RepID=A0A096Y6T4_9EUKA|nr:hypothetical protein [Gloeochaete wittrockiana]AIM52027.1 hypothetical protein [Gloeochaete wittrockiana]
MISVSKLKKIYKLKKIEKIFDFSNCHSGDFICFFLDNQISTINNFKDSKSKYVLLTLGKRQIKHLLIANSLKLSTSLSFVHLTLGSFSNEKSIGLPLYSLFLKNHMLTFGFGNQSLSNTQVFSTSVIGVLDILIFSHLLVYYLPLFSLFAISRKIKGGY